jgi:hypothetical protein
MTCSYIGGNNPTYTFLLLFLSNLITLSPHILVKDYEAKKCIGKVNINLSKCLSCSTSLKACSYHRIRQEVLELIMALSPYYLLHRSPHSGAGIGLRRCGI